MTLPPILHIIRMLQWSDALGEKAEICARGDCVVNIVADAPSQWIEHAPSNNRRHLHGGLRRNDRDCPSLHHHRRAPALCPGDDFDPFVRLTLRGCSVDLTRDQARMASDALRAAALATVDEQFAEPPDH
jgi:hypothetical protein